MDAELAATLDTLGRAGLSSPSSLALVERMIDQQAFTRAADDVFLGSAMVFVALIGMVWFARRPAPAAASQRSAASADH